MTEFREISNGNSITTKNNMNNVMVGNKIEITEDNGKNKIVGIVIDVVHLVSKWKNHQGLERSTHNIIIDVDSNKSLRPQSTWKPSEEQIGALEHFVRSIAESGFASPYNNNTKLVYSLLNDLKKLRVE